MQIVAKLFAVALALIGIAYVAYQATTTSVDLPEVIILIVQLALFLLGTTVLLLIAAILRPE